MRAGWAAGKHGSRRSLRLHTSAAAAWSWHTPARLLAAGWAAGVGSRGPCAIGLDLTLTCAAVVPRRRAYHALSWGSDAGELRRGLDLAKKVQQALISGEACGQP